MYAHSLATSLVQIYKYTPACTSSSEERTVSLGSRELSSPQRQVFDKCVVSFHQSMKSKQM